MQLFHAVFVRPDHFLEEYTNLYTEMIAKDTSPGELQKLKDRLNLLSKKKSKLLEYNIAGAENLAVSKDNIFLYRLLMTELDSRG